MSRFKFVEGNKPDRTEYTFPCPGCKCPHYIRTAGPEPVWQWNGDVEKPTVSPSIRVRGLKFLCHSYIRDGQIQFLPDSEHSLSGQTVDIPDWEDPATSRSKWILEKRLLVEQEVARLQGKRAAAESKR